MLRFRRIQTKGRDSLFARLRRDRRGVSAIEFAFIAPVLILLYFGMAELSEAMMAQRRVSHATSAIGDLAAQHDNQQMPMGPTAAANVFAAATDILAPFSTTSLNLRLTSVVVQADGSTKVGWSTASSGSTLAPYAIGASYTLPAPVPPSTTGLVDTTSPGDSVIVAESTYTYTSPLGSASVPGYKLPGDLKFGEIFYLKPRKTSNVSWNPAD
jgi:Flp pilus assembly protein TadG